MATGFTVTGFREMAANLTGKARATVNATGEALRAEAMSVLIVAQERYVPVDSGDLKESGKVHELEYNPFTGQMGITISFGSGRSRPYAETVDLYPSKYDPYSWRHAKNPPVRFSPDGRGPHFLDIPIAAAHNSLQSRVAMRVKLAMG